MSSATKSLAIVILLACVIFALVFLSLRHRKAQDPTQLKAAQAPRALNVELFDAWPGCHAVPSKASVLFRAFPPPRKRGQFRVVVAFLEKPETATLWDNALGNPETFHSVIERRDRELKETRSEWMKLLVAGTRKLVGAPTRIAVNEPDIENPDDALLNNERALITLIVSAYLSGETDYFYRDGRGTFATSEELTRRGWIFRDVDYYMGYRIDLTLGPDRKSYAVDAVPLEYGKTGIFSFHMQQDGVIRAADNNGERAPASSADITTNNRWLGALERDRNRPINK